MHKPGWDAFDAGRCNMGDTGIGQTSAVGMFPLSDGPWDDNPLDMVGNAWEWTSSNWGEKREATFTYPYDPEDGREGISVDNKMARVLRGGAFLNFEWLVRCAVRLRVNPSYHYWSDGFRVVCAFAPI